MLSNFILRLALAVMLPLLCCFPSNAQEVQCISIPGSRRPNTANSIPDCVRVLSMMASDPRLQANHGWISGGFRIWGTSVLPVEWEHGNCRILLRQHEPSTPVRDTFPLIQAFPGAANIMARCFLGNTGREEGFVPVGPKKLIELHIETGLILFDASNQSLASPALSNETFVEESMV